MFQWWREGERGREKVKKGWGEMENVFIQFFFFTFTFESKNVKWKGNLKKESFSSRSSVSYTDSFLSWILHCFKTFLEPLYLNVLMSRTIVLIPWCYNDHIWERIAFLPLYILMSLPGNAFTIHSKFFLFTDPTLSIQ